jgi:hypothetical protein
MKSSLREPEKGKKRHAPGLYRGAGLNSGTHLEDWTWTFSGGGDPVVNGPGINYVKKRQVQIMTENSAKKYCSKEGFKGTITLFAVKEYWQNKA